LVPVEIKRKQIVSFIVALWYLFTPVFLKAGVDVPLHVDTSGRVGIGTTAPRSTLEVDGSFALDIKTVEGNVTLDTTYNTIISVATVNDSTITLPPVTGVTNRRYWIYSHYANTKNVIIDGNSSETISGSTTKVLSTGGDKLEVISTGTEWL